MSQTVIAIPHTVSQLEQLNKPELSAQEIADIVRFLFWFEAAGWFDNGVLGGVSGI